MTQAGWWGKERYRGIGGQRIQPGPLEGASSPDSSRNTGSCAVARWRSTVPSFELHVRISKGASTRPAPTRTMSSTIRGADAPPPTNAVLAHLTLLLGFRPADGANLVLSESVRQ